MSGLGILSIGERRTVGAARDKGFQTLKGLETALPPRARPPSSLYSRHDTASGHTNQHISLRDPPAAEKAASLESSAERARSAPFEA
eukprot:scaffold2805_cov215-Isochrysis_galbana.AAC.6